jgi:hypothetical protein
MNNDAKSRIGYWVKCHALRRNSSTYKLDMNWYIIVRNQQSFLRISQDTNHFRRRFVGEI